MRVLHVDATREWRGGQTQLLHLATRLPGSVVALPPDALLLPALRAAGVPVLPVAFRGPLRGTRGLAEAIRAANPDLVAAHTSHAHGHAVRATGRPVVVHRRLDFRPGWTSRLKYRRARRFVAVSGAVRDVLVRYGVPADRIDVVLDGVDRSAIDRARPEPTALRNELGLDPGARVCLAVGALVAHKGHRLLVEALALLPEWHGLIAGEGPLGPTLSRQAARLGVGGRLHLLGRREDVPRLHKSVDLVVHPSLEEGMGQAVAEALIAGARVVAADAGGLAEIVDGLGLVVAPGDPRALAEGIRVGSSLVPPDPRRLRGRFTVEAMVAGTAEAYRRALAPG
jgi:glycosyltransferase involved in cell wall biosynthesis